MVRKMISEPFAGNRKRNCTRARPASPVSRTLMPAIRWVAQQLGRPVREVARECLNEHKHEVLLDRFFGIDKLTQEDLEEEWEHERILSEQTFMVAPSSKPAPGTPVDPEKLAYESPKAALEHIARNVLIDHVRKSKMPDSLDDKSLEVKDASPARTRMRRPTPGSSTAAY
jgi:hypothetical protein